MIRLALLFIITLASLGCASTDQASSEDDGWTPLFNGKDLTGWHTSPGGSWEVVDGAIVGKSPKSEKRHGLLITDQAYSDFEVTLQFNVTSGDSGFYFRSTPVKHVVGIKGFQVEVDRTFDTGGLYETLGRAWVVKPDHDKMKDVYTPGEWTDLKVRAEGKNITVWINGTQTAQLTDDPGATKGHFALQLHGSDTMDVSYRNLRIREIKPADQTAE